MFEEIRAEGVELGRAEGVELGRAEERLANVRSLMRELGLTAGAAMGALGIPERDRERYLALL